MILKSRHLRRRLAEAAVYAGLLSAAWAQSSFAPPVRAPEFPPPGAHVSGTTWIHSQPLTMRRLYGQVVLIDFWEYTCINCIRTLATNERWYREYHKYGFTIIGVHDPEFDIAYAGRDARRVERDPLAAARLSFGTSRAENVRKAVRRFHINYPVVVDDWFQIWSAYHNQSWPNRFLIDARGRLRYNVVGEGHDGWLEGKIRKLLREAHPGLKFPAQLKIKSEPFAYAPGCGIPTEEMYIGNWFGRGVLANRQGYHNGHTLFYHLPAHVSDGRAVLNGRWESDRNGMIFRGQPRKTPASQASTAALGKATGELEMRYHARQLYAVINVAHGHPERVYIRQDGRDLTRQNAGVDVKWDRRGHSYLQIHTARLYYLTANPGFGEHRVQLFPTAPGVTFNSFTFGNNCQTRFPHWKG